MKWTRLPKLNERAGLGVSQGSLVIKLPPSLTLTGGHQLVAVPHKTRPADVSVRRRLHLHSHRLHVHALPGLLGRVLALHGSGRAQLSGGHTLGAGQSATDERRSAYPLVGVYLFSTAFITPYLCIVHYYTMLKFINITWEIQKTTQKVINYSWDIYERTK